ncbi:hypothetical protein [Pseudomonas sp. UBA2684]|uniref:hypothetical protein n=1 Tax=Pseudomonas sp. UBA2684 TaxID=1947311 RepID=UPI000E8FA493|nr:hypothetical protein [Pseudomonas sp. UBA2684]HBX56127.1 hypothetical protein [Pseudomonas sp.]|tara:strand:- start:53605 stop:53865 length:261 start_codon:yes stop_codon:yes gene_type:complete
MTTTHSPDHTPATQATEATALDNHPAAEPAPAKKPAAAGFASLFSAAAATSAKNDGQHWNQKGNKSAHEKKIGPAPNGTRRSMGKR